MVLKGSKWKKSDIFVKVMESTSLISSTIGIENLGMLHTFIDPSHLIKY